jgi:hypothetical protein
MISAYRDSLARAMTQRREPQFAAWWAVGFFGLYVAVYLLLCILGGTEDQPHRYFREGNAVDTMSAAFLYMAFCFAMACAILYKNGSWWGRLFWILTALACLFLAIDELWQFHERWGSAMKKTALGPTETFRNWNDVIVILYGLGAMVGAALFLAEILRYPRFANVAALGFAFYVLHTLIDSTQTRTDYSRMWEESMKLFAVGYIAAAMLTALVEMARTSGRSDSEDGRVGSGSPSQHL